jgi:hypothetical protein
MSAYIGDVVKNGLVLYLDAANSKSYVSGSGVWRDLSGNNNSGSLTNGPTFSSANGGSILFDGNNDYVFSNTPNLTSSNYTVMGAARYSGATRGRIINATSNNWLMGHWNNSTENYYAEGWVSSVQAGTSDTNWRIYASNGNISGDSYGFYVNNNFVVQNNNGSAGPNGITLGRYAPISSEYSTAQFSFLLIYDRILTTTEMTQIFNMNRGRFGI